jgi:hypothetical protein
VSGGPLEQLTQAEHMLAEISTAEDAMKVLGIAELARTYAELAGLGFTAVNHAVGVKLRAELHLVRIHKEGVDAGTFTANGRPSKNSSESEEFPYPSGRLSEARTIAQIYDEAGVLALVAERNRAEKELARSALLEEVRRYLRDSTPASDPAATVFDAEAAEFVSEDGRLQLLHGDFRERLDELPDGSVDLIVTDPPYTEAALGLWSDLSKVAARLLGPRGLLFAWSGQLYLPEVIRRLGEHLTFGWTFALMMPGSNSRVMQRHVVQGWKPILGYSTGTWPSGRWADDVLLSPEPAKTRYRWEQQGAPARRLIERYCPTTGLVVDPLLGTGTFGLAALEAGRRFVGVELHGERFAQCVERLTP